MISRGEIPERLAFFVASSADRLAKNLAAGAPPSVLNFERGLLRARVERLIAIPSMDELERGITPAPVDSHYLAARAESYGEPGDEQDESLLRHLMEGEEEEEEEEEEDGNQE